MLLVLFCFCHDTTHVDAQEAQAMYRRQDKVKLYESTFKASEILGSRKELFLDQADEVTTLFTPPICTGNLNELLGKAYTTENFRNTSNFLNLSLDESLPILDSINFSFYNAYSFLNVLDKHFASDPLNDKYKRFKSLFKAAGTNADRRQLLYADSNSQFRIALEDTRYSTYRGRIGIKLSTKFTTDFKLGVAASISEQLSTSYKINASANFSIKDTVFKYIQVTDGGYDEIRLAPEYIFKAARIISGYNTNRPLLNSLNDDFSFRLVKFLDDPNASIITGAAVLEANFDYQKFQQLTLALGVGISAALDSSQKAKAPQIAASVTAAYSYEKQRNIEVTTGQSFYYLRYGFSKDLEIGAGAASLK